MKMKMMLSLLFVSAVFVMPASANWFHNPYTGVSLNVGSAPNPTPADIRQDRLPIVVKDEDKSNTAVAPAKTASTTTVSPAPAQGAATNIAAAAPSR
jgi:hypothetical protein